MLKMFNMALIRCPLGLFEEIVAVFWKKMSPIDTEKDKNLKDLGIFSKFFHCLCGLER